MPVAGDDGLEIVGGEHLAHVRDEQRGQPVAGPVLVAHGLIHAQRIDDAVAGEGVDLEPLLVGGDHLLGRHVEIEDPGVEIGHLLQEGDLPVQAWLFDHALRIAVLHHERLFGLVDREQAAARYRAQDHEGEQQKNGAHAHCPPPVPRLRPPAAPFEASGSAM